GGFGHSADDDLFAERLDWAVFGQVGDQGGVFAVGGGDCVDVYRAAVCGAHASAGARGFGCGVRRGGGKLGREPAASVSPGDLTDGDAGVFDGVYVGVCACVGRVRFGGIYFGQHADADGDHVVVDHDEIGAVRLCGRDGDRGEHAG